MTLRLRTFGAAYLERDGTPLGGAHSQRRRLGLLAFLAAAERGVVPRPRVIALLWPESDEASARHSLSQLLYALRQDLGAGVIAADNETVRLNSELLPSDVRAFDNAIREGRLEDAIAEYRGAFLDDLHVDGAPELNRWVDQERDRRARECARALDRLVDRAEASSDWHRAVDLLHRRVGVDPADSRATVRLMLALAAIGDRDGALRAARAYATFMREQLETDPHPDVTRLEQQLRRAPVTPSSTPAVPADTSAAASPVMVAPAPADSLATRDAPRPRLRWYAIATVVGMLAVLTLWRVRVAASSGASRSAAGPVTVVVGDLEGPEPTLTLAVREALRAELVNARGVRLTSDIGIREIKTLMRLDPDSALGRAQLVTLATRSGSNVVVAGSVVPMAGGAQIIVDLIEPETGRSLRTYTERPTDGAALLAAVGRVARAIGDEITRVATDTTVRPLPAVTTASLPALKSYAEARRTAAMGKRREAIAPAERAVTHDSGFVLAHYFLGDLLWFLDEQTHSEAHLQKAYELISTVPRREQLVIRARYEQLVRDRPDSALAYWQLLHDASPGELLAYEGRAWALRALGRHEEAAASADTAMTLDPGAVLPNVTNAMYSWLAVGDTAGALAIAQRVADRFPEALIEARYFAALFRNADDAMPWAERTPLAAARHWRRHLAQISRGDLRNARVTLDSVMMGSHAQQPPNALINQGWAELALQGDRAAAARFAREALAWTRRRDLSPPAIGRLTERIADLAARAGDEATVRATIALVHERDRGRSLPTYELTLRALNGALAFARGDYADAARRTEVARHGIYFSRSLATLVQLEADAWRAAGNRERGDSLARLVTTHRVVDGHFEAWAMLHAVAHLRDSALTVRSRSE
jgi:DNA-binding SARP family transcriptional activator